MNGNIKSIIPIIVLLLVGVSSYFGLSALGAENQSDVGTWTLLVIDIIGLYYIIRNINSIEKSNICRPWVLWIIWMLILSFLYNPMPHGVASFLHPIYCPIIFLFSFVVAISNNYTEKIFVVIFSCLMVILSYFCFVYTKTFVLLYNNSFFASNFIFYPLCCLPFVFLIDNKKIQYILLALLFFLVLYCQKRSATIAFVLIIATWIITQQRSKQKVGIVVLLLLLFVLISRFGMDAYLDNIMGRMKSMSEDEGSGRVEIWEKVINMLSKNNILQWLFGRGEGSIVQTGYPNAHNDALQLLYEFGLPGFLFYIAFVVRSIKCSIQLYREKSHYYMGYFSCVIIIVVMGLVSNLFTFNSFFAYLCAFMGMVEGVVDVENCQNSL